MDGTLIEGLLDFQEIRRQIGIPADCGILEAIAQMPPQQATEAHEQLIAHELHAARTANLMPHALQTLQAIQERGHKTALLTRNTKPAMDIVLQRFNLTFDLAWSRENGPIKPEPDGIHRACKILGVTPQETICVGDFYYDLVAANAAGAFSILLAPDGLPDFAEHANMVITELSQLLELLDGQPE